MRAAGEQDHPQEELHLIGFVHPAPMSSALGVLVARLHNAQLESGNDR